MDLTWPTQLFSIHKCFPRFNFSLITPRAYLIALHDYASGVYEDWDPPRCRCCQGAFLSRYLLWIEVGRRRGGGVIDSRRGVDSKSWVYRKSALSLAITSEKGPQDMCWCLWVLRVACGGRGRSTRDTKPPPVWRRCPELWRFCWGTICWMWGLFICFYCGGKVMLFKVGSAIEGKGIHSCWKYCFIHPNICSMNIYFILYIFLVIYQSFVNQDPELYLPSHKSTATAGAFSSPLPAILHFPINKSLEVFQNCSPRNYMNIDVDPSNWINKDSAG